MAICGPPLFPYNMTTTKRIRLLNERLAAELGRNVYGEPIYKWVQAGELQYPARRGTELVEVNGVLRYQPVMAMIPTLPMLHKEQWVVAKWFRPGSIEEWERETGTEVGFPHRGLYFPSDVILSVGLIPNDDVTSEVIGAIKTVRGMKEADFKAAHEAKQARIDREKNDDITDFLSDRMTAFGNVPGSRGGVTSFPEARPRFTQTQPTGVAT